ncbi:hypothetical protein [Polaribacter sp. Asnod6-C07]|uniref:hypothetical protein n=1 Tax=Polaribacter sp. Asnod6-C07 TaxID=3160582 RepID=UPI00386E9829
MILLKRILNLIVLFLLLNSCKSTKNQFLFDIQELNLKYKKIQKLGYKPVEGQINRLTKSKKDTSIYIGFDRFKKSRTKTWTIKFPLKKYDLVNDSIYKFLISKNIPPISRINYYKDSLSFNFSAHNEINGLVYICQVSNDIKENKTFLHLSTYLPFTNKEIKRNIKFYKLSYKERYPIIMYLEEEKTDN